MQAGKGGELTRDETTIIAGALELTEKTVRDVMTPISRTFAIDINAKLNRFVMDNFQHLMALPAIHNLHIANFEGI